MCNKLFMACRTSNKVCSVNCNNRKFNGTYGKPCIDCGKKARNPRAIRCAQCKYAYVRRRYERLFKSRFFSQIMKTPTCWLWKHPSHKFGYGWFYTRNGAILSHRLSYQIHNGDIPNGMHVLHKCDNPPCVNPKHLYVGTNQDNGLDKTNKNRWSEQNLKLRVPRTINRRKYVIKSQSPGSC